MGPLTPIPPSPTHLRVWYRRHELGLAVLLVALTAAVYAQVRQFVFVSIDDALYVTKNAEVQAGLNLHGIRWAFSTIYYGNWIPFTWLSLMVDAMAYGGWAGGYHITNVAFHMANVLLVFSFFLRATGNTPRSAFVAALFAIHPLHVESVAWVSERKDVLSIFFGLLSLNAYLGYTRRRRLMPFVLSSVLFVCSLLAKQTLVTLPFIFCLMDFWPLRRVPFGSRAMRETSASTASVTAEPSRSSRSQVAPTLKLLVLEKVPFFLLSAAFSGAVLFAQNLGQTVRPLSELSLLTRILNAILVYGLYLQKAVLPFGLAAFYPHPGSGISLVAVGVSSAFLSIVTTCAIAGRRRHPYLLVGWLWYLGSLVPMIGLIQVGAQQMADRYVYFPLVGMYAALAWLVPSLVPARIAHRRWLPALATGVVGVYACVGYVQVGYWRDGIVLMHRAMAVTEDNAFVRYSLGDALLCESRFDEGVEQFQIAIQLAPQDSFTYLRLGYIYECRQRIDEAEKLYRMGLTADETNALLHLRLGAVLLAQHEYATARNELNRSIELQDRIAETYFYLALLCRELGDYEASTTHCERALMLNDRLVLCHRLIGANLRDRGRLDEAADRLRHASRLAPDDRQIQMDLERVLSMQGN